MYHSYCQSPPPRLVVPTSFSHQIFPSLPVTFVPSLLPTPIHLCPIIPHLSHVGPCTFPVTIMPQQIPTWPPISCRLHTDPHQSSCPLPLVSLHFALPSSQSTSNKAQVADICKVWSVCSSHAKLTSSHSNPDEVVNENKEGG
jgi:hypothetical protein